MLLRCSICKGQFEVEPSPNKNTVFCSHCGTPLDMRPKSRTPMSAKSPAALNALGVADPSQTSTVPQESAGNSLENLFAQPDQEEQPAPIAPRPSRPAAPQNASKEYALAQPDPVPVQPTDPLAQLAQSSPPSGYSRPAIRRMAKQKKSNNMAIIVVVVTVLIAGLIIGAVLVFHGSNPPAPEPVAPVIHHDPGELFPNKAPEPAPPAQPAADATPAAAPPADTPSDDTSPTSNDIPTNVK